MKTKTVAKTVAAWRVEWKSHVMTAPAFWYFKELSEALAAGKTLNTSLTSITRTRVPSLIDWTETHHASRG